MAEYLPGHHPQSVTRGVRVYRQNADGSWSAVEPIGWQEEHSWLQRLIFWLRGIKHCSAEDVSP
jgi:hypothetical protein